MSRSYKKNPGMLVKTKHGTRWWKRHANKVVRRCLNVPNGRAHRKVFNTYTICDYRHIYHGGRAQVLREYTHNEKYWQLWIK